MREIDTEQRGSGLASILKAGLVFAGALAWLLTLRDFGFQLEDEGLLLMQIDRYAAGDLPYSDFQTGYTPGFYGFWAWLTACLGNSTVAVRGCLAVVNAASVTALYLLARRVAGGWIALLPALLWLLWIPIYPGEFASFNVPYPAWLSTLAWLLMALALARPAGPGSAARSASLIWPVLAGVAAAACFAVKPNSGALAVAGLSWSLALSCSRPRRLDSAVAVAASALGLAVVASALSLSWNGVELLVHGLPCTLVALLCARSTRGNNDPRADRAARALPVAALAFALPTLGWVLPLVGRIGFDGLLREVFFLGSDLGEVWYFGHTLPSGRTLAIMLALAGLAALGRQARARRLPAAVLSAPGLLAAAAAVAAGLASAIAWLLSANSGVLMPESLLSSLVFELREAAPWCSWMVAMAGVVYLWRCRGQAQASTLAITLPLALAMYVQFFPRADFMHWINAAPLLMVVATALLARVVDDWKSVPWPTPSAGRTAVAATAAIVATAVLLLGASSWMEVAAARRAPVVDTPTVTAWVEEGADDDLGALAETAAYLAVNNQPGKPVLAFPALGAALYAAGIKSASSHDYWYPGGSSREDEQRVVARLKENPPRLLVTLNDGWRFFHGAAAHYRLLSNFARSQYKLVARYGRFDVLALEQGRDSTSEAALPPRDVARPPRGQMQDCMEPRLAFRRQAAVRWMHGVSPKDASVAKIPSDERDAVLLLRALRDGGSMKAAAWLVSGYNDSRPRVRNEALGAMQQVLRRHRASLGRWAGDFRAEYLVPWTTTLARETTRLQADEESVVAEFAESVLATLQ